MRIQHVPSHLTAQVFPLVEGFIAQAMKHSGGDYSIDQIRMFVNQSSWALFVAIDDEQQIAGAMTVSFMNYPNDRIAFVTSTGGKNICTKDTLSQLKGLVKGMGATKLQAAGRDSVARMLNGLGFKKRYTVVETTLGE